MERHLRLLVMAAIVAAGVSVEANWPSFRGERASGVADASLPAAWNASTGSGIRWRMPVAGLSHASPIAWNGRVYVLSAVTPGAMLDMKAEGVVFAKDTPEHEWRLHCLDANNGREIWMRVLHKGVPRQPRHVKGSYANATPATNGTFIALVLGNEGLFVTDMDGRVRWRKEMAPAQADWSLDAASSPIIVDDMVVVQNDWQRGGFVAAFDLSSGQERWRVPRSEGLSWSTPGVWSPVEGRAQIVLNSPRWIRAHDARDGREIWRMNNSTEGPYDRVPTPVTAGGLILHRGLVYVCGSAGVLTVLRASDGSTAYRVRVAPDAGTFSASPIAAGGRVYLSSEDGEIFVIAAGETFELVSRNPMGAPLFATPAVAGQLLIVRTAGEVFGISGQ